MNRLYHYCLVIGTLFLIQACSQPDVQSLMEPDEQLSGTKGKPLNFTAHLSSDQEVHLVESRATGQVKFQVSKDGQSVSYKLIVANIQNVTMAHIHLAPAGSNGPVAVWLYPSTPPMQLIPGRTDGILAQGTFTKEDFNFTPTAPLNGEEMSSLVELLQAGTAYVNVHTTAYPAGEIRGQIK